MVFLRWQTRQLLSDQRVVAEGAGELGQEAHFCQVPTEVLLRINNPHVTHKSCFLKSLFLRVELHKRKVLEQSELEQERRYEDLRQQKVALDQTFQRVKAQLLVRIFAAVPSSVQQPRACNWVSFQSLVSVSIRRQKKASWRSWQPWLGSLSTLQTQKTAATRTLLVSTESKHWEIDTVFLSLTNTCTNCLFFTFMSLLHRQQQCHYSGPALPQSGFGSSVKSFAHSHSYNTYEENKTKEENRARFSSILKKVCVLVQ